MIISLTRLCGIFGPSSSSVPVAGFGKDAESPGTPGNKIAIATHGGSEEIEGIITFQLGLDQIL